MPTKVVGIEIECDWCTEHHDHRNRAGNMRSHMVTEPMRRAIRVPTSSSLKGSVEAGIAMASWQPPPKPLNTQYIA